MGTANIPQHAQFSEAAEYRNTMAMNSMTRLQHKAWRAFHELDKTNTEIFIICIQVYSRWRDLVEYLMPGNEREWQETRAKGGAPVALGTVMWPLLSWVAEEFPDIKDIIMENPEDGMAKCIILSEGGCTVIDIKPKRDTTGDS